MNGSEAMQIIMSANEMVAHAERIRYMVRQLCTHYFADEQTAISQRADGGAECLCCGAAISRTSDGKIIRM